jgi:hypothetical protein
MKIWAHETIRNQGSLPFAGLKDQFSARRKYATAFLEHLASIGITVQKRGLSDVKNSTINHNITFRGE